MNDLMTSANRRAGHRPNLRNHCAACGLRWPCDWSELCDETDEAEQRIATLEAALARANARITEAKDALLLWEKFAWYISGEAGYPAIAVPLFQAMVAEEARARGKALLTALDTP